jgi:hypothetical protein
MRGTIFHGVYAREVSRVTPAVAGWIPDKQEEILFFSFPDIETPAIFQPFTYNKA